MNKNTFTTVTLNKGEMNVYDFGGIKLHAYKTNDFIDDEVFIVEKNGKAVIIESPCFFDNIKELTEYLNDIEVEGMLSLPWCGRCLPSESPEICNAKCGRLFRKRRRQSADR